MNDPQPTRDDEPAIPTSSAERSATVIRLDDFLKRCGLVGTGGEAKLRIQSGEVLVNGNVETRRRKQLAIGDVIEVVGETVQVTAEPFQ